MKTIARALYRLRIWLYDIIRRPPQIRARDAATYDEYWEGRRGATFGALSDWQHDRLRIVVSELGHSTVLSIADVGCGDGAFLSELGKRLGARTLWGYDMSERALAAARTNGIESVSKLDLRDRVTRTNLAEVDVILLFEVLEHLVDAEDVLSDMCAQAKKSVFFSVPNTGFLTHRFRLLFGKFPVQWAVSPNEHVRFWTVVDMRWWLTELKVEHAHIIPYRGVPILNRLWPNLFAEGILVHIHAQHH